MIDRLVHSLVLTIALMATGCRSVDVPPEKMEKLKAPTTQAEAVSAPKRGPDFTHLQIRDRAFIEIGGGKLFADRFTFSGPTKALGVAVGRVYFERAAATTGEPDAPPTQVRRAIGQENDKPVPLSEPLSTQVTRAYGKEASFNVFEGSIEFRGQPAAENDQSVIQATDPTTVMHVQANHLAMRGPSTTYLR